MEELLIKLVEAAKKNKKHFMQLKNTAVMCQQYELAAKLRDIELETFVDTLEDTKSKAEADEVRNILSMSNVEATQAGAWIVFQAVKLYQESKAKGVKITVDDCVALRVKRDELFGE